MSTFWDDPPPVEKIHNFFFFFFQMNPSLTENYKLQAAWWHLMILADAWWCLMMLADALCDNDKWCFLVVEDSLHCYLKLVS